MYLKNQELYNKQLGADKLYHIDPIKYVPTGRNGNVFLPYSSEAVLTSKRYVLIPTGYVGYTPSNLPLSELINTAPYNQVAIRTQKGPVSLPTYVNMIAKNFTQLIIDKKVATAWVALHSYIQGANEWVKEVQTSNQAQDRKTDALSLAPFYQAQDTKNNLFTALIKAGLKYSQVTTILTTDSERTKYLAMAPFYEVELPQRHTINYTERNFIAQVGIYAPDTHDSGTESICLLSLHDDGPKYTSDDYASATTQVEVATHRYLSAEYKLDEDVCILQTLYYFNLAKTDDIFIEDEYVMGMSTKRKKHYDMDPAPTTREEYRLWEQKHMAPKTYSYRDDLTADTTSESDNDYDDYSADSFA